MKSVRVILAAVALLLGVVSLSAAAETTAPQIAPPAAPAAEGQSCKLPSATLPFQWQETGVLPSGYPLQQPGLACTCFCCNPFNYCRTHYGPQYYCETESCQCEHV